MVLDVGVRVTGVDFDDPDVFEVMGECHPHVVVTGAQPYVVSFAVDENRPVGHAVDVVRALQTDLPSLVVAGVDRDLVNVSDIAHRVGLSREGVRKWAVQEGFPTAQGYLASASMQVWAWTDIVEWLKRERCLELDESLPSIKVLTQIENCLMKNPDNTTVEWHHLNGFASSAPALAKAFPANMQVYKSTTPTRGVRAQSTASRQSGVVGTDSDKQLIGIGAR